MMYSPVWPDPPDHVATHSEAMHEYADNAGMDSPDSAWLLTSYDVWVKNPHYSGPPQPHPEDYEDDR